MRSRSAWYCSLHPRSTGSSGMWAHWCWRGTNDPTGRQPHTHTRVKAKSAQGGSHTTTHTHTHTHLRDSISRRDDRISGRRRHDHKLTGLEAIHTNDVRGGRLVLRRVVGDVQRVIAPRGRHPRVVRLRRHKQRRVRVVHGDVDVRIATNRRYRDSQVLRRGRRAHTRVNRTAEKRLAIVKE